MLIIKKLLLQIKVKTKDLLFLIMLKETKLPSAMRERINNPNMEDIKRILHKNFNPKENMHH